MTRHPLAVQAAINEALRNTYVFAGINDEDLAELSNVAEWVRLNDRVEIMREGEPCRYLYVLANGRLVVKEEVANQTDLVIARITPGNVVGELGFADRQVASATIRCEGPCELVRVTYDDLERIFHSLPRLETRFLKEIIITLSERLRKTNKDLRSSINLSLSLKNQLRK